MKEEPKPQSLQQEQDTGRMIVNERSHEQHSAASSTLLAAAVCGAISSIGYTLANICLRSITEIDPVWVSQVKTIPTVLGVLPFVLYRVSAGLPTIANLRLLGVISLGAVIGQVGGNIAFQYCLGIIGIALAVPITMGAMIVSGALLGKLLLNDPISKPIVISSAVLMLAILVLMSGSREANASMAHSSAAPNLFGVILGVCAAVCAGLAYSSLAVVIRYATNRGASITSVLFVVGIIGFVLLGCWVQAVHGFRIWTETSRQDYAYLWGAGIFNVVAFAALSKSLQLSSLMFVNAINATQIAMAAIAGVLLFHEPVTAALVFGIVLTIFGLQLMRSHEEH